MSARTVRQAMLARLPKASDERGSLPMLMLVMLATVALGTILLTFVINQTQATRFDQTRIRSLHAAQTGIDVMLGKIRAAVGSDGTGDDGKLPNYCPPPSGTAGPLTGTADDAGRSTYSVTITYWTSDPRTATSNDQMICTDSGPYNPNSNPPTRTPRFAVITSYGYDSTGGVNASKGRTIEATYVFQTNDVNITGGQIRIFPAGSNQWCMDAGSNPAVGTAVMLQACSTSNPPIDQQVWAYRSDLSIELVSTAKTSTPLCIDTTPTAPTAHSATATIVLRKCVVPDSSVCPAGVTTGCTVSPWNQQWSVDDSAHLEGAKTDQSDIDGFCINAPTQAANTALTLASCKGSVTDTNQTWVPSPTTGAGMAGAGNKQLVNYKQFAMCLDVTGQNVNASYLILYTCKQNPNPSKVAWNQKFTPSPALGAGPTKVLLTATTGGVTYCLKSPRAVGGYPVLSTPCPSSVTTAGPGFVWTVDQKYTDATKTIQLNYADKYTIRDDTVTTPAGGLCLAPGNNSDLLNGEYYKAVVANCDGSTAQKWNADASLDAATVTNTHEVATTGS